MNVTPFSDALEPLVVWHSFSVVRRSCGKLLRNLPGWSSPVLSGDAYLSSEYAT
jgi:hypothetical protein